MKLASVFASKGLLFAVAVDGAIGPSEASPNGALENDVAR